MRVVRNTVIAATLTAAGLTLAGPAQAAQAARTAQAAGPATAAACKEIRLYKPEMRKGKVAATAWGRGCGKNQRIIIELQRKRWYGWQKIASASFYGPGPRTLYKSCKKGSTYTYRLWGKLVGGGTGTSPTLRARCR